EPIDLADRPRRTKGLRLFVISDVDAALPAVSEHGSNQVAEVTDGQNELGEVVRSKLVNHQIQNRPISDRQKRLGQYCRVGAEARPLAAREDHRSLALRRSVEARSHSQRVLPADDCSMTTVA